MNDDDDDDNDNDMKQRNETERTSRTNKEKHKDILKLDELIIGTHTHINTSKVGSDPELAFARHTHTKSQPNPNNQPKLHIQKWNNSIVIVFIN
mmetsp:Transcript_44868/g.108885  ORF Transcript_44868/g.108885 Transcript_44868/m.108885 type:complete len:94 (+) Transcript_44868:569-850(+)